MTDRQSSPALRGLRAHLAQRVTIAALVGAIGVLAIVGPFGTGDRLALGSRAIYWGAIVVLTYGTGYALRNAIETALRRRSASIWSVIVMVGLATGLAALAIVLVINMIAFRWLPDWPTEFLEFALTIIAIASVISGAIVWAGQGEAPGTAAEKPAILKRLPLKSRGHLVALSAQDHYVQVETTKGGALVLIRLADAMAETTPVTGLQVHRSHWIALNQVVGVQKDGERAIVTMSTGATVPVSRKYKNALRDAGIL